MAKTIQTKTQTDWESWARGEAAAGNAIYPVVTDTTLGPGHPYSCTVQVPDGEGPILFGQPHVSHLTELSSIGGVDVVKVGMLEREGVGIYVRAGR